mgnify:CR=1 FL=1
MTKFDVFYYGMLLGIAMIVIDYYFIPGGMY